MAESLRAERGSNGADRASFLEFVERIEMLAKELQRAQETVRSIRKRRKDLRNLIEAEGFEIHEFDRALVDAERSGEEREAADRAYRRYMAWLGKPVGFQTALGLEPEWPHKALSGPELSRVEREGFTAGKRGDRADSNSWTPGREEHQRWHSGWLRGQAEKVEKEIKPLDTQPPDAPRRRGRPLGSPNKPKIDAVPIPTLHVEQGNGTVAPAHLEAQSIGREDGAGGHQDHAARYPAGTYGHADYWIGYTEGKNARYAARAEAQQTSADPPDAA